MQDRSVGFAKEDVDRIAHSERVNLSGRLDHERLTRTERRPTEQTPHSFGQRGRAGNAVGENAIARRNLDLH